MGRRVRALPQLWFLLDAQPRSRLSAARLDGRHAARSGSGAGGCYRRLSVSGVLEATHPRGRAAHCGADPATKSRADSVAQCKRRPAFSRLLTMHTVPNPFCKWRGWSHAGFGRPPLVEAALYRPSQPVAT
jgi:hypothetical protein